MGFGLKWYYDQKTLLFFLCFLRISKLCLRNTQAKF